MTPGEVEIEGKGNGKGPHIVLVGMMGAGKTTVGELVAGALGWPYRDSDADVVAATGLTVPEIMARDGEAAFRQQEAEALARACADPEPTVISAAGGSVLSADNRRLMKESGTVVWLRARAATLAAWVGDGAGRPLLDGDPARVLTTLNTERAALYEEVADLIIDVDDLTPEGVANMIMAKAVAA
jgi:shikimate kinase